ncbi:MAG: bifunctional UDP-N-acetylmuramoyl-tripeptide:D-alanyl-D-alanine ligase/alanine racemase [Cyclobacteriaceae bacterium]|nr:bifunctional UDP-N-acetylmuramoyl-tripeptide:D-alanyl-D-alanine ligase/alanine racemase [Cyclobacteriaceae bacterium]
MTLKSSELPEITRGRYLSLSKELEITFLSTDSRKTVMNPASLFFAIHGLVHDGHHYIDSLYRGKVRQFVIEDPAFDVSSYPEANFFLVKNSIHALQDIARWHRNKFDLHVIGITGSNGKTMVKEWLSQLLSWRYNVIKTPRSFNSQIGVPLSIWQIQDYHQVGVFEAGISKSNEMQNLQMIIDPHTGILTNIGPAHDEGFASRKEKLIEKLKLFAHSKILIYHDSEPYIKETIDEYLPGVHKISWNTGRGSKWQINLTKTEHKGTEIRMERDDLEYSFFFQYPDNASIENIIHVIIYLLHSGWEENQVQEGILGLSKISMRLEMKKGINDCYIIDDSYSNDLAGLEIALNYMNNQNQRNHKSIILTDILQSGMSPEDLYQKTSAMLGHFQLNRIITIGPEIEKIKNYLNHPRFYHYKDTEIFLEKFPFDDFNNEIILVKGARKFGLEVAARKLQEKIHGTVLEINLDALSHNLNVYRSFLDPNTKIMVMVKALAYGSGSIEVANLLEFHRIDYLGVAYVDEAVTLRKNGISLPVMIMNPASDGFENIIDFRLEPEIYSIGLLKAIDRFSKRYKKTVKIHIKIDTGMHRLGFQMDDLDEMLALLVSNPYLEVTSVFSHLAAADEPLHDAFTTSQVRTFESAVNQIRSVLINPFMVHIANSAAILRFPHFHFDMVRLGIGLYGFDNTGKILDKLMPIGRLKTTISQIIHLKKGDSVGYGRIGRLTRDSTIATVAIGYADGFSRAFGNGRATVYINGQPAPVIGNVCMDMTMIDVTGLDAREGNEVIIFGPEHPLHKLAEAVNTIPYEILTNVSERVKRVYVSE